MSSTGARPPPKAPRAPAVSPSASPTRRGRAPRGGERLALELRGDARELVRRRPPPGRGGRPHSDLHLRLEQGRAAQRRVRRQLLRRDARRVRERVADGRGATATSPRPAAPGRGRAGGPTRPRVRRGMPLPRPAGRPGAAGCGRVPSGATRARGAGRAEAPRRPEALLPPPRRRRRRSLRISARWTRQRPWRLPTGCPAAPSPTAAVPRPTPRPASILREAPERTHQLAVDKPCEERVEFPGDHGHGRFVEKPQALGDVALQDDVGALRRSGRRPQPPDRTSYQCRWRAGPIAGRSWKSPDSSRS